MLRILGQLPAGLVDRKADQLADALGGPSLIRMAGQRTPPLFVSVLLHGNETTGWEAMRLLLDRYRERPLPRALDLFVGNVHAAREGRRRLQRQLDYNRVWKGVEGAEGQMASQLLAQVRARPPQLALDIHNTSGWNPAYACAHRLEPRHLALARSFSDTVVYIDRPDTLLGIALSAVAPAITMECGTPGVPASERAVADFIDRLLRCEPALEPAGPPSLPLLRCAATVRVPEDCSLSVTDPEADLRLMPELDRLNFSIVPAGTPIASVRRGGRGRLEALDVCGRDVSARYFRTDGERLVTRIALMPSLLTGDQRIIRQDCLCYLMEPLNVGVGAVAASV